MPVHALLPTATPGAAHRPSSDSDRSEFPEECPSEFSELAITSTTGPAALATRAVPELLTAAHSLTHSSACHDTVRPIMSNPLMTVIMPSYNAERFIAESIESVVAQTIEDWELIVVDDASTDGTPNIVAAFQHRDPRIRLIAQEANQGPAHARNLGLDHARGELIAFIDSDDIWFPQKSEKQIAAMTRSRADLSYTAYQRTRQGARHAVVVVVPASVSYDTMLRRCFIGCSTAIVRRSTCGSIRMPAIKRRQDHGYWLELLRDGSRTTVGVNEPLVSYRLHPDSLSANKLVAARYQWKLLRDVERFGIAQSLWLFTGYATEALKLRFLSSTYP